VQEFQIMEELLIACGGTAISGDTLCGFHFTYGMRGLDERHALFGPAERHLSHKAMRRQYSDTVWDLTRILNRFADRECADPRDKVFGLRGIMKQGHLITVDYRRSTKEIFDEVVDIAREHVHYSTHDRGLDAGKLGLELALTEDEIGGLGYVHRT
jgi:hypothetical protein